MFRVLLDVVLKTRPLSGIRCCIRFFIRPITGIPGKCYYWWCRNSVSLSQSIIVDNKTEFSKKCGVNTFYRLYIRICIEKNYTHIYTLFLNKYPVDLILYHHCTVSLYTYIYYIHNRYPVSTKIVIRYSICNKLFARNISNGYGFGLVDERAWRVVLRLKCEWYYYHNHTTRLTFNIGVWGDVRYIYNWYKQYLSRIK